MAEQNPTLPPSGFYWLERESGDLEVIEVDCGEIYRTGSDEAYGLQSWPEREFLLQPLEGRLLGRVPEPGPIDHADLLRRYVALVTLEEGYNFMPRLTEGKSNDGVTFTPEEVAHVERLSAEAGERDFSADLERRKAAIRESVEMTALWQPPKRDGGAA